jgi:putative DNA primase/helicase
VLVVAESGERKTTCDGYFSAGLREWARQQHESKQPEVQAYRSALAAWEAQHSGIRDAIKSKARKGEFTQTLQDRLTTLEADKPIKPMVPHLIYGDATPEALAFSLAHDWPSAGLLSSEAGVVFGGHGMQRESIMRSLGLINVLWDGGTHTITRRTSESYTIAGRRLTVSLMAQLPTLRDFVERAHGLIRGTGFLSRFLIAWPESAIGGRAYQPAPETWPALARYNKRIFELLSIDLPMVDGVLNPAVIALSAAAFEVWRGFADDVEHDMRADGPFAEVRDIGAKAAENAARLAGMFHVMKAGVSGDIDAETMRSAIRIVAWHLTEAKRLLGEIDASPELSAAERLSTWLVEECRRHNVAEMPTREIANKGPNPMRTRLVRELALRELTSAGHIAVVEEDKKRVVKVNPLLLDASA